MAVDPADVKVSWVLNSTDEDGVRVYLSYDDGARFSQAADLAAGTESYTENNALHGANTVAEVEVYTADAASRTGPSATLLTDLPPLSGLTLDNGVEDEIAVPWNDTINNGQYRIEYRKTNSDDAGTDPGPWQDVATVAHDGTRHVVIPGLLDGEEYEVRGRTETDAYGATDWVSDTIITKFPAVTNFTATAQSETDIALSWTDNADNELFYEVLRERDYDGSWGSQESLAQLDPNTESYTDDSAQPDARYRYVIRGVTSYTFADSGAEIETAGSLGVPQTRTRRSEWTVEIEHPRTDTVLRPDVLEGVEWQPQTNGLPTLSVPVPKRDRWLQDGMPEDAGAVRVWKDGAQLPIDELVAVSPAADQIVLECSGGRQLKRFIESKAVDENEAHLEAGTLIQEETDYAATVDDPDAETESDVQMLRSGTLSEFRDRVPLDDTDPAAITTGGLTTLQTGWWRSRDFDLDSSGATEVIYDSGEMVDNRAARLSGTGERVEETFTPQYALPANTLRIEFYLSNPDGDNPPLNITFNKANSSDTVVDSIAEGALTVNDSQTDTRWLDIGVANDELVAGETYEWGIEVASGNGNNVYIDVLWVGDSRWNYDFDDTTVDGDIDGPQLYPQAFLAETIDANSVRQVLAARLETVMDDTSNQQALAVSNDLGNTWLEQQNTTVMDDQTFSSGSQQVRGRFTISRYGNSSGTNRPKTGYQSQTVESFELLAQLDDTPMLLDKELKGRLVDVLANDVADAGDFVWELRRDPAAAWDDRDGLVIEWTQAGQRTRSRTTEPAVDVSGSRTIEGSFDRIVVQGAGDSVEDERFTAQPPGDRQGLDNGPIVVASETVYDPSDGTEFTRGDDYLMTWLFDGSDNAGIEITSEGAMVEGTEYAIDYRYKYRGVSEASGVTDPSEELVRISDATSNRECEQLALAIRKRVQEPLEEATLTVATDDPTQPLVEALSHEAIPFDGPLVVRDKSVAPGRITWQLGSRQTFREVINEIEEQFAGVADQL